MNIMKELVQEFETLLQVIGDERLSTEERIKANERISELFPLVLEYQKEVTDISDKLNGLAEIMKDNEQGE